MYLAGIVNTPTYTPRGGQKPFVARTENSSSERNPGHGAWATESVRISYAQLWYVVRVVDALHEAESRGSVPGAYSR